MHCKNDCSFTNAIYKYLQFAQLWKKGVKEFPLGHVGFCLYDVNARSRGAGREEEAEGFPDGRKRMEEDFEHHRITIFYPGDVLCGFHV